MLLLLFEHFISPLDHPMLTNALYIWYHLQHQSTHCHENCPKLDHFLIEQKKQRAMVFHLHHIQLLWLGVENHDIIGVSIAKQVHYYFGQMPLLPQH
jgi:hypothetical protein